MVKDNFVKRSAARGGGARGTSGLNSNGADAYKQSLKSKKGNYRVQFVRTYEQLSNKDVDLRHTYAKQLIAREIGVPADLVILDKKRASSAQTLTALDEVFYVKVGVNIYGKISIRTQRNWKSSTLMFIYQTKFSQKGKPPKPFSKKPGYKKRTKSQKAQTNRKSYNTRPKGKH